MGRETSAVCQRKFLSRIRSCPVFKQRDPTISEFSYLSFGSLATPCLLCNLQRLAYFNESGIEKMNRLFLVRFRKCSWGFALLAGMLCHEAAAVECMTPSQGTRILLAGPSNLIVPAATPDDTEIWRSPVQHVQLLCQISVHNTDVNATSEAIYLWLNPEKRTLASGVVVGLIFKGVTYVDQVQSIGNNKVDTGLSVGRNFTPISFSYQVIFVKKGQPPQSGTVPIDFAVYQPDGVGGLNGTSTWVVRQRVTGNVTFSPGGTCALAVGDSSQSVRLPSVAARSMDGVGATAGRMPFSISISNCSDTVRSARFIFNGRPAADDGRYFSNTGTAAGVAVRIGNALDNRAISPAPSGNESTVAVANKQATLPLFAEYVRTGMVTPGSVVSRATVDIIYQ
ncbi:fimbrial protein [Herbaspirillum robiniae]|uniref:fimbrial protein n=1 Tax=Herbaspirillum robiniae TaxID=2014887 RepID=UPI003D779FCE